MVVARGQNMHGGRGFGISGDARDFADVARRRIADASRRLDEMRQWVERQPGARRSEYEPTLDRIRGLLNRAKARLERVRMASDGLVDSARGSAVEALDELCENVHDLESRLPRAA